MKKLLLILFILITLAGFSQMNEYKIRANMYLITDSLFVIGTDTLSGTTQIDRTDTIFVTLDYLEENFVEFIDDISHYQLDEPEIETSDSLIFYMYDSEGYWRLGKGILDTSMIKYIEAYATIEQLNDSVLVLRGEIPSLLTELDSTGFRVDYGQLLNVPAFLTSETDPIFNAHLASDITTADTTWWGEQPTYLIDLDSAGFTIDTSQVRDLQTFVANNSGSASISGTEGYLPKFGASGLTESNLQQNTGVLNIIGQNSSSAIEIGTRTTTDQFSFIDFIGDSTYSDYGLRIIRNNTGANTQSQIRHRGTGGLNIITQEAAPLTLTTSNLARLRITPTGNVGIGTTNPTEKLEVDGNIKCDTIKAVFVGNHSTTGDTALFTTDNTIITAKHSTLYLPDYFGGSAIRLKTSTGGVNDLMLNSAIVTWNLIGNSTLAGFIINKESGRVGYQGAYGKNRIVFPAVDGSSGQVLTTNGNGVLYFSDGGGSGSGDITGVLTTTNSMITGGGTSGDITLVFDIDNAYAASSVASADYMPISRNGNEEKVRLSTLANFFGSGSGSMIYPTGSGIPTVSSGSSWGTTISPSTGYLYYNGSSYSWSNPSGGGMVYPSAGIAVSTGTAWGTSITNNSSNWNTAYGWGDHSTKGYLTDAPSNGSLYGRKNGAWTVISTGTSAVTSVVAGNLVDVSSTTGDVTVNVDLSEATSDNTFSSTDKLIYVTGASQKCGTVSGLESYMQSNLSFGGATNLSTSYSSTNVIVNSDTGDDATINAATTSNAGVMSAADKTKLDLTTTANTTNTNILNLSLRNHLKYTTSSSSATITISNPTDLKTGNIEVVYNYSSGTIITFQVPSSYTLYIAANIYNATVNNYTKSILKQSLGISVYSYYISGTNIYINGTQSYF